MKTNKFNICKFLVIFNLFFIPLLFSFFIIVLNNYEKFNSIFKTIVLLSLLISTILLIISFGILVKGKMIFNGIHTFKKVRFAIIVIVYVLEIAFSVYFVYYNETFKNWLITSSFTSIKYQNLASSIYSEYTVDDIVGDVKVIEDDIMDFDVDYDINLYANKYEKQILEHDKDALYKIIKITGTTSSSGSKYVGYLAAIYDPSHVKLAKSTGAGTFEGSYGETLATISRNNNALVAINAGGFFDPNWNSNGGIPHGDVFIDGKLDSTYKRGEFGGGLIGFTKDDKLVLKRMSTQEAIDMGIRDAVDWGPFLIVDGVNQFTDEYTSWECARTAIAQRKDGIVLFLVIDGLQKHSQGASYKDLADILEKYGAINAANLDGGTSASMTENGEYINSPWNGTQPTFRWFPNAWIVTK